MGVPGTGGPSRLENDQCYKTGVKTEGGVWRNGSADHFFPPGAILSGHFFFTRHCNRCPSSWFSGVIQKTREHADLWCGFGVQVAILRGRSAEISGPGGGKTAQQERDLRCKVDLEISEGDLPGPAGDLWLLVAAGCGFICNWGLQWQDVTDDRFCQWSLLVSV